MAAKKQRKVALTDRLCTANCGRSLSSRNTNKDGLCGYCQQGGKRPVMPDEAKPAAAPLQHVVIAYPPMPPLKPIEGPFESAARELKLAIDKVEVEMLDLKLKGMRLRKAYAALEEPATEPSPGPTSGLAATGTEG